MLLDPRQATALLRCALEHRFALLAVNADSPAALTDCLEAARACDAPLWIETSLWQLTGHSFGAGDPQLGLARYLAELTVLASHPRYASLPIGFHTDHIKGPETLAILRAAIQGIPFGTTAHRLRASTLSLDSSELTESENIAHLIQLARFAEEAGVPVALEMEAGVDVGVTEIEVADRLLGAVESTVPGRIQLWAPGVGTQHGLSDTGYPFSARAVEAHHRRASQLCGRPIGIALHGSSGLAESDLREGIAAGIAKVNWSSESLLLRSQAARDFYKTQAEALEKRHPRWKSTAMDHGVQSFVSQRYIPKVIERLQILGAAGKASLALRAVT